MLRADGVCVRHPGADVAVGPVDLELSVGEVVLLLGPSGCGKSSFTLTVNGLVPHSYGAEMTGTVTVSGRSTVDRSVADLSTDVGMVFQDPDAQIVTNTVWDEVCFGCENLLLAVPEVERRAAAALAAVGLTGREADDPDRLSGGGRQRLALACALAMGQRLLVLDEPTANLDPLGARDLYRTLAGLVSGGGHGVLLVEHDLDLAMPLVDRVVVLDRDGAMCLHGPPRELFGTRAAELAELGVWVPTAVLAARRLAAAGVVLPALPLTPEEAGGMLAALPTVPSPACVVSPSPVVPTGPPAVAVTGLSVVLGGHLVLRDVTLAVPAGDLLAVVGGNGAGKTTLAAAIGGVRTPPRDTVAVDGRDVAATPARELSGVVGFVFQNPEHQFVTGSVFDELAHGLRVRSRPAQEVTARVGEMLERFGLAAHAHRNPFLLSHGQKRRLSVATALIGEPAVLVLDEPTFGQDRAHAEELMDLLTGLNRRGHTVVMVTHDLQLVADRARHVAVLADGSLLAHDTTAAVLGDDALLVRAGLPPPPLRRMVAASGTTDSAWAGVVGLADLRFAPLPARRPG